MSDLIEKAKHEIECFGRTSRKVSDELLAEVERLQYTNDKFSDELADLRCEGERLQQIGNDLSQQAISMGKDWALIPREERDKLQARVDELVDFAIWMTGCGYDFTQHDYFCKCRDKLLKGSKAK